MVSGALLLNRNDYSIKRFYIRKTLPLVGVLIFWSTFYFIQRNSSYPQSFTFENYIQSLLIGTVYGRLWFLYAIIGLYFSTPFIARFVQNATKFELKSYLILWFINTVGSDFISYFYDLNIALDISLVYGYVGYFVLGYYLSNEKNEFNTMFLSSIFIILNILTIIGTFLLSRMDINNGLYLYRSLSPNVILMAITAFILAKKTSMENLAGLKKALVPVV